MTLERRPGPLTGLRVLDFTTAWAGPMATRGLAFLGAHVIKIENPKRLDSWRGSYRGGVPERFPDKDPGAHPYNRNCLFNSQSHDKWSLSLDLKAPGAVDVVRRLAADTDVVVANYSPGVLDRLGVGYSTLVEFNPRIIVVEMPAFGTNGPLTNHVGMGKTMEAANGMASLIGYGDGKPQLTGPAYMDPIGGINATAAVLTALVRRERTGQGAHIEVAQTEASTHWIGERLLEQLVTGHTASPEGNHVPYATPHDAFPCAGVDEWAVIAVRTDQEWQSLCHIVGPGLIDNDGRWDTATKRRAAQEEIYQRVSQWTRPLDKHEVARRLQSAGVPAAPVNSGRDVFEDAGLRAAGMIVSIDHPEAGVHDQSSLAYRLLRTPGLMRDPAPCFGQHTHQVLRELLGLDETEIADLERAGTIAAEPTATAEAV